ncbi:glycosyltransferase [Vibrio jasicida]|uniref:glycosyltransferase n=1 Tax=Vibrio jasicida TaxID=766224 RepID=UPI0040678C1C
MKILQINVRATEGGAARVMNTLGCSLIDNGYEVDVIYGYSKGARPSQNLPINEINYKNCTSRFQAIGNYFSSLIIGKDIFRLDSGIFSELDEYDVIHFHALHSHMMAIEDIEQIIDRFKGKIIWTLHDFWLLTGRCAVPGDCLGWKNNCEKCAFKNAYPRTIFDFESLKRQKFEFVEKCLEKVTFICPSKHLYRAAKLKYPQGNFNYISNCLDPYFESYCIDNRELLHRYDHLQINTDTKIVIVANNLSDKGKNDWSWAKYLKFKFDLQVYAIGNNMPKLDFDVEYLGVINDRAELCDVLSKMDALLFTSSIDNNPLILIEAISLGLHVMSSQSSASDEILSQFGLSTYNSSCQLAKTIEDNGWEFISGVDEYSKLSLVALETYGRKTFIDKHLELYFDAQI